MGEATAHRVRQVTVEASVDDVVEEEVIAEVLVAESEQGPVVVFPERKRQIIINKKA